jgi:lipopolysaccharide transport system ATP-binding protein
VLGLGGSFDGTLTGAENALTALIVNGMSRRAAAAELPAVREFAELDDFFESPVRTYSAGMGLRLAFAVATRLRARAFLVDEVLSVGDLRFQEKCVDHLRGLCESGATILMATHDLDQALELCEHAVWLQAGGVRASGAAGEVIAAYRDAMRSRTLEVTPAPNGTGDAERLELRRNRFGSQAVRLEEVRLNGGPDARIEPGGALEVEARLLAAAEPAAVVLGMSLWRAGDELELIKDHADLGVVRGDQAVSLTIDRLDLAPGEYFVDLGVYDADWSLAHDYHWGAHRLEVVGAARRGSGILRPPVRWGARTG